MNWARTVGTLVFVLGISAHSWGQLPEPRLGGLVPSGLKRGESATVELRGSNLEAPQRLWFDHPGLSAEKSEGNAGSFRISAADDVPPGWHEVRVLTRFGLSNAAAFLVGELPESTETEPNNKPPQASAVAVNTVVNGELSPAADVDWFAFEGKAGQRLFLDLFAFRIHSMVDGRLALYGPDGKALAESQDDHGLDPMLDVTLPVDGRYTVEVQDLTYSGSNTGYAYRLMLHDGPHLDAILPTSARPGELTTFRLFGRNLGGSPVPGLTVDGQACEIKEISLRTPLESSQPITGFGPLFSWAASRRGFSYRVAQPAGIRAVFVARATAPVMEEVDQEKPQVVEPPCEISGMLEHENDRDIYQFHASKGQTWSIQAMAERLGSPADLSLVVQRLNDQGEVTADLAFSDDLPEPTGNFPASLASTDASLKFQAPEDGLYQIVLADLYGTRRGDARFTYRLCLRKERPSFDLYLMPEDGAGAGLALPLGGRTVLVALANRLDGFEGPIRVSPENVPEGLRIEEAVIAPGQFQAPVVITALEGATTGTILKPRFLGQPLSADGFEADGTMSIQPAIELEPLRGEPADARGGFRLVKAVEGLPLAVVEQAPFTLTIEPARAQVKAGESVDLKVKIDRAEGFAAEVQVEVTDLPANLPTASAKIEKDASEATIKLAVPDKVKPGQYTLLARGQAQVEIATDAEGKNKKKVNSRQPSNPLRLTVQP